MASKRPSVKKREREQLKRERRSHKAAKTAERRATRPSVLESLPEDNTEKTIGE